MMNYYAHSLEGRPVEEWQPLEEHLENVAKLASEFAKPFGGEEWARIAGLWHDLGKYSPAFQKKLFDANGIESHLETKPGKVIHSQAGGHLAQQVMTGGMERIFCWLIMGHHAGLTDFASDKIGAKALEPKLRKPGESCTILQNVPDTIKTQFEPSPPALLVEKVPADLALFIRMLFSCIVDADFLDTEVFMNAGRAKRRNEDYPSLENLLTAFDTHMAAVCSTAKRSTVNRVRAAVLNQCRQAAESTPAVFSLTVPTGGGKTLSSLAFALRHAMKHGLHRIIYVIPYTSIIEQTAQVFRNIPGFENAVLEHHSNIADEDESKESVRRRLASENWDAPIVVTTAVQFFESLYSCKTSRCRKLHNICNSVVIFDEAQCLPPEYLRPVVFAIRELHRHYGVTPVLCTATQPVLTRTESFDFKFPEGFEEIFEIIEDPTQLVADLDRVVVEQYADLNPTAYVDLAKAIQAEGKSVLCIVNRKKDCRELALLLPEAQTLHLSTNMCPKHRLQMLDMIRKRLSDDTEILYVISTSLVEAGVDLDFPVVYRALAGLDSIAQAAGRCNREGKRSDRGRTVVFLPEDQPDYVTAPASLSREFLSPQRLNKIFQPETFDQYFRQRFFQLGEKALDKQGVLSLLSGNLDYYFRTAAEKFKLIDDAWQLPLIVPFGKAPELVDTLLDWDARSLFRNLQQYTISIPKQIMWTLLDNDYVHELKDYPGTYYLHASTPYTERFGLIPPDEVDSYDPMSTIT